MLEDKFLANFIMKTNLNWTSINLESDFTTFLGPKIYTLLLNLQPARILKIKIQMNLLHLKKANF